MSENLRKTPPFVADFGAPGWELERCPQCGETAGNHTIAQFRGSTSHELDAKRARLAAGSDDAGGCTDGTEVRYLEQQTGDDMRKTKKTPTIVRQGDVLLMRVEHTASELESDPTKDPRGLVLADGESSGHYHAVFGTGAKLCRYKATGRRVVVVAKSGGEIRVVGGGSGGVDRHTPISLEPGQYEVRIQRSWTSEQYSREMAD